MRKRLRHCAVLAAIVANLLSAPCASAMGREAQIKAAYIFKFASFVRWPPEAFLNPSTPLRVCVFGRRDILGMIGGLSRGASAGQRPMQAMGGSARSLANTSCHVLFLGEGGAGARTLREAQKGPVLTISDRSAGSDGGVIELVPHADTVRFVVHKGEADRRRLALSSKLLAVAEEVVP